MWVDNASEIDLLFYRPYADVIMKILLNSKLTPITIGLFGSWGAGKSTLLNFIEQRVAENKNEKLKFISVNAWQLEGYDDAKTAIIEAVIKEIEFCISSNKKLHEKLKDKIKEILRKVNWLKIGGYLAKKTIAAGLSLATANPLPIALSITSDVSNLVKTADGIEELQNKFAVNQTEKSPAKTIREVREEFQSLLKEAEINNLIVTVDDLDRCLPDRIVETLEAVKLFLSVDRSTFIFAVDENIVRYAIRRQYPISEANALDISKDYIEKIIQLPVTLPELSSKDISNYLLLLVAEKYIEDSGFAKLIKSIDDSKVLTSATTITKEFVLKTMLDKKISIVDEMSFNKELDVIDGIRDVVSSSLRGNPRQAKRFLNAFSIKKELSVLYFGENIDLRILAKLMALYIIDHRLFMELQKWYNEEYDGELVKLRAFVEQIDEGKPLEDSKWSTKKAKQWFMAEPKDIYLKDLREYFYLTRDFGTIENDFETGLNSIEKKFMQEILASTPIQVKSLLDKIQKEHGIRISEILKTVISKYGTPSMQLNKFYFFFEAFPEARKTICQEVKNKADILGIKDLSIIALIKKICPDEASKIEAALPQKLQETVKKLEGGTH